MLVYPTFVYIMTYVFLTLEEVLRWGRAELYTGYMFNVLDIVRWLSNRIVLFKISTSTLCEIELLHLLPTLVVINPFNSRHSNGFARIAPEVLICVSLKANDSEHFPRAYVPLAYFHTRNICSNYSSIFNYFVLRILHLFKKEVYNKWTSDIGCNDFPLPPFF